MLRDWRHEEPLPSRLAGRTQRGFSVSVRAGGHGLFDAACFFRARLPAISYIAPESALNMAAILPQTGSY